MSWVLGIETIDENILEIEDIQYLNDKRTFNTIYTIDCEDNTFISRVEIILFITYDEYLQIVPEFEDRLRDEGHIRVLIKVYDSYKLKQNQEFLGDLYQIGSCIATFTLKTSHAISCNNG